MNLMMAGVLPLAGLNAWLLANTLPHPRPATPPGKALGRLRVTPGFSGGWTSGFFMGKGLVTLMLHGILPLVDIQTIDAKSGQPPVFPGVDLELIFGGSTLEQEVYERN
jgi:hypothetical protein